MINKLGILPSRLLGKVTERRVEPSLVDKVEKMLANKHRNDFGYRAGDRFVLRAKAHENGIHVFLDNPRTQDVIKFKMVPCNLFSGLKIVEPAKIYEKSKTAYPQGKKGIKDLIPAKEAVELLVNSLKQIKI